MTDLVYLLFSTDLVSCAKRCPPTADICKWFKTELTHFDEIPENSNKRPTYTVSSDPMQEKKRLQFYNFFQLWPFTVQVM